MYLCTCITRYCCWLAQSLILVCGPRSCQMCSFPAWGTWGMGELAWTERAISFNGSDLCPAVLPLGWLWKSWEAWSAPLSRQKYTISLSIRLASRQLSPCKRGCEPVTFMWIYVVQPGTGHPSSACLPFSLFLCEEQRPWSSACWQIGFQATVILAWRFLEVCVLEDAHWKFTPKIFNGSLFGEMFAWWVRAAMTACLTEGFIKEPKKKKRKSGKEDNPPQTFYLEVLLYFSTVWKTFVVLPLAPLLPSPFSPLAFPLLFWWDPNCRVRLLNVCPGQRPKELHSAVMQRCGWGENLREQ